MRNLVLIFILLSGINLAQAQNLYKTISSDVGFFSATSMEDIKAKSKEALSIINTLNNEIAVVVGVRTFHFESALMEEHFNENYMESDKYKLATFKGKINEKVDFTGDFTEPVTATGLMEMHGVSKQITLAGVLTKKGNQLTLKCTFKVALKDYNITVPKVVGDNIAEVIEVISDFLYEPKQK